MKVSTIVRRTADTAAITTADTTRIPRVAVTAGIAETRFAVPTKTSGAAPMIAVPGAATDTARTTRLIGLVRLIAAGAVTDIAGTTSTTTAVRRIAGRCGDYYCGVNENSYNCPSDCGGYCGDYNCGSGEDYINWPVDCVGVATASVASTKHPIMLTRLQFLWRR